VREVVADAAGDGVVWVQPHFDPHLYPQFGAPRQVMELVLAEGLAAGARHGVGFGVTIAAMRHRGPGPAEDLARFAAAYAGRGVHALGLTGDESAFPPGPFARAFAIAREAGLAAGVGCSLGADDPLMFGAGLLDEYKTARGERGLTDRQLAALARTSIRTSGAPASIVAPALAGVDTWLSQPGDDHGHTG